MSSILLSSRVGQVVAAAKKLQHCGFWVFVAAANDKAELVKRNIFHFQIDNARPRFLVSTFR
jgi:hypothetical protein